MTDPMPADGGMTSDAAGQAEHPPRAYAALRCALSYMRRRCEQLTYALASRDAVGVESLAQDCVHYWLVAAAALRRLERSAHGAGHHREVARQAVARTARLLLMLLDCGVDETTGPTSSGFAQLRFGVALAIASHDAHPEVERPEPSATRTRAPSR